MNTKSDGLRAMTVRLTPEVWRAVKKRLADDDTSFQQVATDLVDRWLAERRQAENKRSSKPA